MGRLYRFFRKTQVSILILQWALVGNIILSGANLFLQLRVQVEIEKAIELDKEVLKALSEINDIVTGNFNMSNALYKKVDTGVRM